MSAPKTAREHAAATLLKAVGSLSSAAMAKMEREMPWFTTLSAEDRSWVGMVLQAGVKAFIHWFRDQPDDITVGQTGLVQEVFGAAPRALAGVINLQQTVELVRLTIDVVEQHLDALLGEELAPMVHLGVLQYGRELAFATAEVYARAAEQRGAWDARLEALVVDSVLRSGHDDTVLSRASALGWVDQGTVVVLMGSAPEGSAEDAFHHVRRIARQRDFTALCAVQGDRMVVVLGGAGDPMPTAEAVTGQFADGPVVVGPRAESLTTAHLSAVAATAGHRVAGAWPDAPRPVLADDLLPERVLAGDTRARQQLLDVHDLLAEGRGTLVETLDAWFTSGRSTEATGRALFVHPNTVRYRLRQVAELTGLSPTDPREAHTLALALTLGRLERGLLVTDPLHLTDR